MAVVNFVDIVPGVEEGTPLNRRNMMAIQGYGNANTVFNADGSITETFAEGVQETTFNDDGSIVTVFTGTDGKVMTKTVTFNDDGSIAEVVE